MQTHTVVGGVDKHGVLEPARVRVHLHIRQAGQEVGLLLQHTLHNAYREQNTALVGLLLVQRDLAKRLVVLRLCGSSTCIRLLLTLVFPAFSLV